MVSVGLFFSAEGGDLEPMMSSSVWSLLSLSAFCCVQSFIANRLGQCERGVACRDLVLR